MTVVDPEQRRGGRAGSEDGEAAAEVDAAPRIAVPAALRRLTWRSFVFAPVLAAAILAVPFLAWKGFSILRNEDTGQVIGAETDPNAPGFQALVTPTPVGMLIDEDAQGGLAGVTLITLPTQEGGGNLIFLPVGTVVEVPLRDPPEAPLNQLYAEAGVDAVEQRVSSMMGAAVTETITVPEGQWARLVAPVAPLSFENPAGVEVTTAQGEVLSFPEGPISLPAEQVGAYLQARGPDEADTVRLTRHEAFWMAWLAALDEAGPSAVPGEGQAGVGGFVRGLTGGPRTMQTLPVTPIPIPGVSPVDWDLFRPNVLSIVAQVPDWIPFPVGVDRLRTRLVVGVEGQGDQLSTVARTLVQSGAELTVIANDDEFDEEETVVYFFREADRERAQRMLDALGTGELVKDNSLSDTVEVVVVLGRDYFTSFDDGAATPTTGVPVPATVPTGGVPAGGIPGGVTPGAPGGPTGG